MPHRQQAILEVESLTIGRGTTTLLDRVSWKVETGQHWVILGANGSGKTSLLRAITGYLTPSDGEIRLLGERYGESDWRELRRRIGMVSSSLGQMMSPEDTAECIVAGGLNAMIGVWGRIAHKTKLRAAELLDQVECRQANGRCWEVLSQGERQRVLIARSLIASPEVLILDEPCAGLDPGARENFLEFLTRLRGRRHHPHLVLVTHHVEEILPVFTHVLVLRKGRVFASGRREEIMRQEVLNAAFGTRFRLSKKAGRYNLELGPA